MITAKTNRVMKNRAEVKTTNRIYMKQLVMITVAALMMSFQGISQTINISLDTVKTYRNDSVIMPVYVSNFTNIGAITIYIQFDTTKLAWGRAISWNSGLNGNIPLLHHKNGTIGISWIDVTGVTLSNGLFFELKFKHKQGHAPITIGTASEFANPNGIILNHTATGGLIWEGLNLAPDTNAYTICVGNSIQLNPKPRGGFGTLIYSWSSSAGGFSSNQPTITVSPIISTSYSVTVTDGIDSKDTTFAVDIYPNIVPVAPVNMLPADSATDLYQPYNLSWSPSPHATKYDLYLWNASQPMPSTPTVNDILQINYQYNYYHLSPGTWYKWKVVAKNQCYSTSSLIQNFQTRALPNLHVTSVTTSQPMSGQSLTVSWTVKNDGLGPTTTPQWVDRIWLSGNFDVRIAEADNILLGQYQNVSALNAGQSYVNTVTVQIPQNLMGPYFLFVMTDMIDAYFGSNIVPDIPYNPPPFLSSSGMHGGPSVVETENLDNFYYVQLIFPVPPLADLVTTNLVTPNAVFSGQEAGMTFTVKNRGTNTTPPSTQWFDKIWLTTDTVFNLQTAVLLATRNHSSPLDPDSIYKDTLTVNIPNNIYGTYYILVQNDATNQLFENIGEDNNFRYSDPITVFLSPPADLSVAFMSFPDTVSIRQSAPFSFTIVNQGGMATPSTGYWDAIYMSTLDTFNIQQSTRITRVRRTTPLPIGGTYTQTLNAPIPANLNGYYYIYIFTDQENQVFEHTNKQNNVLRSPYAVAVLLPDYESSLITIPALDNSGGNIPVTWRLNNNGPGTHHISSNYIINNLYISSSPVWIEDSMTILALHYTTNVSTMCSQCFAAQTYNIEIPEGKPGPFYIYVLIDKNNNFPETTKNNNIGRSTNAIQVERPDLIVTNVTVPTTSVSGSETQINWTIKNSGSGTAQQKTWRDRLVMSRLPVYYPDSTVLLGEYVHDKVTLGSGDSVIISKQYVIPHGYSGDWYFYVITDVLNNVYEKNGEQNNVSNSSNVTSMTLGPWADLQVMSITLQDTATQGDIVPLSFTVKNSGNKTTPGSINWKDRVYLSSSPVWNSSNLKILNTQIYSAPLLPDSQYTIQLGINVAMNIAEGFYYVYVFTDFENAIYEYINESNNILRSAPIYINPYPPIDLSVTNVTAPASSNSGNPVTIGWGVQNVGAGTTLAPNWYDAIYLSQDPVLSPATDYFLAEKKKIGPLTTGQSYSTTQQVTIPNGISGTWYIIVVTDDKDVHFDINRNNNSGVPQAVAITLTPSPDLVITDFSAPVSGISGQPVTVTWKVLNNGAGNTISGGWVDRFYLSSDYVIDGNDKILGSKAYTGTLAPGQFYEDTAEFFVPSMTSGNYILIIKTDNNNIEYEHNAENNNTVTGMMLVVQPPPADLVVLEINIPDSALAGDQITISWKIKNLGTNEAKGWMKDNVYLSTDTVWEVTDLLAGSVFTTINISPQFEINRSVTFKLPGLTPGDYHAIIRTDVANNIFETDETNNESASLSTLFMDVPELQLKVLLDDTLFNLAEKHYRIIIPDSLTGETMITELKGDSINGVNELYLTRDQISSRIKYDYSHSTPYLANQDIIVPFLDSGSYFLLAYGYNTAAQYQAITLRADIMEFEIRNVFDNKGGNSGMATIMLEGSKFDSLMTVFLDSNGIIIPASSLYFENTTKSFVTFNLAGEPLGLYDVVAVKKSGDTARYEDGFRIIQGEASSLGLYLLHAANSRPGRVSAFTIEFGNLGNVDLVLPVIKVGSLAGAPIALDPSGLSANNTTLIIPLSIPGEPPGILRPGIKGSIMVYTKSTQGLGFIVTKQ